jgi:hypothetical protein
MSLPADFACLSRRCGVWTRLNLTQFILGRIQVRIVWLSSKRYIQVHMLYVGDDQSPGLPVRLPSPSQPVAPSPQQQHLLPPSPFSCTEDDDVLPCASSPLPHFQTYDKAVRCMRMTPDGLPGQMCCATYRADKDMSAPGTRCQMIPEFRSVCSSTSNACCISQADRGRGYISH